MYYGSPGYYGSPRYPGSRGSYGSPRAVVSAVAAFLTLGAHVFIVHVVFLCFLVLCAS